MKHKIFAELFSKSDRLSSLPPRGNFQSFLPTLKLTTLIDKYVIMPNHIHLIIVTARAEQSPAPTIGDFVCALKSITTKTANRQDNALGRKIWQRSYHDHIIRNEHEYQKIWQYIDTNPLKWEEDCFYGQG